ncbi:hypothetical protein ACLB2K_072973 [Fragaria x ananassa]
MEDIDEIEDIYEIDDTNECGFCFSDAKYYDVPALGKDNCLNEDSERELRQKLEDPMIKPREADNPPYEESPSADKINDDLYTSKWYYALKGKEVNSLTYEDLNGFGGDGYSEVKHVDARAIPGWVTYWEAAPELPETKPGFEGDGYSEVKHVDARAIPGWVTYWEAAPELPETKPGGPVGPKRTISCYGGISRGM